jgi:hypothetical protein
VGTLRRFLPGAKKPKLSAAYAQEAAGAVAGAPGDASEETAPPDAPDAVAALLPFISGAFSGPAAKLAPDDIPAALSRNHREWFRGLTGGKPLFKGKEPPRTHSGLPREKDDIPAKFKLAEYMEGDTRISMVYAVFHGNRCVVTLAHRAGASIVLNCPRAAEAIAGREDRKIGSLRFYHLWVEGGLGPAKAGNPGGMRFEEMILACDDAERVYVKSIIPADCPGYVVELFKDYAKYGSPQSVSESASKDF